MSAWLLPDHIADVLPHEARQLEELRRHLLDTARCYGYELVIPPLLEHLDSLLTGSGRALDLQTFKLVDQLSGRMLGLRADTTPQVARMDAHLLARSGVTRLCYCGPTLHTRPAKPHATREPLQFGAELYGHGGIEADMEVLHLALACLSRAGIPPEVVDLSDARIVQCLLDQSQVSAEQRQQLLSALASKDAASLATVSASMSSDCRNGLLSLLDLYGGVDVLDRAQGLLPPYPLIAQALQELRQLAKVCAAENPSVRLQFDLSEARGWGYYSGMRFALLTSKSSDVLVRGGRYDGIGAVFGHHHARQRAAVGFSLDLKHLAPCAPAAAARMAIRAPWHDSQSLRAAISALRAQGEIVVSVLPGQGLDTDGLQCDRELIEVQGQWVLQSL